MVSQGVMGQENFNKALELALKQVPSVQEVVPRFI